MQDRTKDIRVAVSAIAGAVRMHDTFMTRLSKGESLSEDEQRKLNDFPSDEITTSLEFLAGNLLADIHTIARAQSKLAGLEPWIDPLFKKGKGKGVDLDVTQPSKVDSERG